MVLNPPAGFLAFLVLLILLSLLAYFLYRMRPATPKKGRLFAQIIYCGMFFILGWFFGASLLLARGTFAAFLANTPRDVVHYLPAWAFSLFAFIWVWLTPTPSTSQSS